MDKGNRPLYKQVEEYILEKVNKKIWLPGYQLPAENELAEMFKVSRITTKKAMENLTRDGVIVRKKGQGSFVAIPKKNVSSEMKKIVSMIIPYESSRPELMEYINGATEFLATRNYFLTVHCTKGESVKKEREYLLDLPREGVQGIIYYPLNVNKEYDILEPMYLNNYPIVTIDKYLESPPLCSVVSDNYNGAYEVMTKLISLGHRRIAFITRNYIENASSLKERYSGYCKALKDNDIPFDLDIVIADYSAKILQCKKVENERIEYIAGRLEELLKKGATSIFIENDVLLIKACDILINKGISFPKNFCIAGFDRINVPEFLKIPVIAVQQDYYEIGRKAAEIVCDIMEKGEYKSSITKIPVSIVTKLDRLEVS